MDTQIVPLALSMGLGIAIMSLMYFIDYTLLLRFPKTFYYGLAFITAVVLAYDVRNGLNTLSYSYTFYLLLLFPIVLVGLTFHLKHTNPEMGLLRLSAYLLPPLFAAAILSSIPAIIYLIASDSILIAYVLKNKWFSPNRMAVIGMVGMFIIVLLGLLYIDLRTNMLHNFFAFQDNYLSEYVRQTLRATPFIGSRSISTVLFEERRNMFYSDLLLNTEQLYFALPQLYSV